MNRDARQCYRWEHGLVSTWIHRVFNPEPFYWHAFLTLSHWSGPRMAPQNVRYLFHNENYWGKTYYKFVVFILNKYNKLLKRSVCTNFYEVVLCEINNWKTMKKCMEDCQSMHSHCLYGPPWCPKAGVRMFQLPGYPGMLEHVTTMTYVQLCMAGNSLFCSFTLCSFTRAKWADHSFNFFDNKSHSLFLTH